MPKRTDLPPRLVPTVSLDHAWPALSTDPPGRLKLRGLIGAVGQDRLWCRRSVSDRAVRPGNFSECGV